MLLHNQQQFLAEDKAVIHNFLYPVLENASETGIPRSKSGASKSRSRWAAHTPIGNVWEYLPRGCRPFHLSSDLLTYAVFGYYRKPLYIYLVFPHSMPVQVKLL